MKLTDTIKTAWQGPNTQVKGVASRAFQAMIYGRGWEDFTHWDKRKIIEQAYERNAPFYAATSLIAKTVASMPIYVEAKERGRSVRSDDHPILRLMDRNAPIDELMLYTALYYVVTGESYTNKVFSAVNGKPLGLITLPSQHIDPVQGDWRIPIKGYKYTEYSEVYFDRDEIIYIKTPNLREYWHGMSAAVPGGELIDLYNAAITWNKNVALGGGVPPIVGTAPGITPDEAQRLKDNWQAQSGAANAHRLRIIPQNLTIERFSDKPQEAEWKEAVMMTMRMILMNLGVSSELLNDGANKTYANYETARASLYTEACIPIAETILSAFTRDLQRYYDDNPKLCIDRNAIEAIQENRDVKVKWVTSLVDKRIMTPKQAADELGIQYDGAYFEQNKPQQAQPFQPAQPQPDEGEDDAV